MGEKVVVERVERGQERLLVVKEVGLINVLQPI